MNFHEKLVSSQSRNSCNDRRGSTPSMTSPRTRCACSRACTSIGSTGTSSLSRSSWKRKIASVHQSPSKALNLKQLISWRSTPKKIRIITPSDFGLANVLVGLAGFDCVQALLCVVGLVRTNVAFERRCCWQTKFFRNKINYFTKSRYLQASNNDTRMIRTAQAFMKSIIVRLRLL